MQYNLIKYGQPHRKNDKINLLVMDADMQGKGEEDTCGLHAIANAFLSLALGIDPTEITYDERAMREHLSSTVSRMSSCLTMFPNIVNGAPSSVHKKELKRRQFFLSFVHAKRFTLSAPGVRFGFNPNVKTWPRRTSPQEPTYCISCQAKQVSHQH